MLVLVLVLVLGLSLSGRSWCWCWCWCWAGRVDYIKTYCNRGAAGSLSCGGTPRGGDKRVDS